MVELMAVKWADNLAVRTASRSAVNWDSQTVVQKERLKVVPTVGEMVDCSVQTRVGLKVLRLAARSAALMVSTMVDVRVGLSVEY